MALALPEPAFVDPFHGAADLAARVLRTPLAPEISFEDDPLRMLRAARFVVAARRRRPVPELVAAIGRAAVTGSRSSSAERIRDELSKLLLTSRTRPRASGCSARPQLADEFLPELNAMRLEQDPIHTHKDVLAHTIAVVRNTRPRAARAPRRAVPRRRQAEDALVRRRAA